MARYNTGTNTRIKILMNGQVIDSDNHDYSVQQIGYDSNSESTPVMAIGSLDPVANLPGTRTNSFNLNVINTEQSNILFHNITGSVADAIQVYNKITGKMVHSLVNCTFDTVSTSTTAENGETVFNVTGKFEYIQSPDV